MAREPDDYDCSNCDEKHPTSTDGDGYTLANCPVAGTVLVETPGGDN